MNPQQAQEATQLLVLQAVGSTTEAIESLASTTQASLASTTEAIYTIGYSLQLFLGLFTFLAFLYIGYKFMTRYI
jgi:hypothetical protein